MDPTVTAPTLGGLGGLPPPGVNEVVTTGYAGGPLGVALPLAGALIDARRSTMQT